MSRTYRFGFINANNVPHLFKASDLYLFSTLKGGYEYETVNDAIVDMIARLEHLQSKLKRITTEESNPC